MCQLVLKKRQIKRRKKGILNLDLLEVGLESAKVSKRNREVHMADEANDEATIEADCNLASTDVITVDDQFEEEYSEEEEESDEEENEDAEKEEEHPDTVEAPECPPPKSSSSNKRQTAQKPQKQVNN